MDHTVFICKRDNLSIVGQYFKPEGKGAFPVAILSHGFTGNYGDMKKQCEFFASIGYAAFSFSFCGGSADETDADLKSQGLSLDMTLWTEVQDLLAVLDFAKRQSFTDEKHILLYGESQGGVVSAMAAARLGSAVENLILIYPALCIPDHARRGILGGAKYDVHNVPQILDCGRIKLSRSFHHALLATDIFLEISAYKGPVLIFHGENDFIVNYRYSERAQEEYGKERCHLILMPDAGHGFSAEQQKFSFDSIRLYLSGKKEILTISVVITHVEEKNAAGADGVDKYSKVYFTAWCDNENFKGGLLAEGCDSQTHFTDGRCQLSADYTLCGKDFAGQVCKIKILNQNKNGEWKPTLKTDSSALSFLNDADLTATLDFAKAGPVVHIWA